MVIKVLGWKDSKEKSLKDIKQKDTLMLECDKCHKKFSVKFKATRNLLNRQFCKKCKTSDTSVKLYGVTHYLSSSSDEAYSLLTKKFGPENVKRQYGDNRYPFACDFYLPKDDAFIECHFSWTHSDSAFDPLNSNHLKKLSSWISKSENHPYYKQAAKAWTQYDVKKRNLALTNELNYLEFFKLDDLKSWLRNE